MRFRTLILVTALSHLGLAGTGVAAAPSATAQTPTPDPDSLFVTAAWLAERIGDENLVPLHVGPRQEYDAGHLPGARYISMRQISTDRDGLSLQMLSPEELVGVFESLGISDDSRIVIYFSSGWVTPTARVYLALDRAGLGARASILDGGRAAWEAEGGALTAELPTFRPGSIHAEPRDVIAQADWLSANLKNPRIAVVDARHAPFYSGQRGGHGMRRAGHIAGAASIPYPTVIDEETLKLKPLAELRAMFEAAGAEPGDLVVTYCHIGQQASLVYLAARRLGYDARLYDGSFDEWSNREDLPVEWPAASEVARLISTDELAGLLEDESVRVLDLRSDLFDYLESHIPGALYVHYETLRATRDGVPGDLLSVESYAALFSQLGISLDAPVVIYASGASANFNATFLAWILRGFGHPSVRLLDGGYDKWVAESRPGNRTFVEVAETEFPADGFGPALARLGMVRWLVENAEDASPMVLVDVRPVEQYRGEAGAQVRRGHIPGAINHVWSSDLVTRGTAKVWKPLDELRASYEAQGITPDKHVIVYCNTGTEATHVYFALRELLSYPNVDVYVPSWTDWSARADLPITTVAQSSK